MNSNAETALSISISELTKTYGDVFALNSVSLDIRAGEFLTLLGPSGSGKTTALKTMEDNGYKCLDNFPVNLLEMLIEKNFLIQFNILVSHGHLYNLIMKFMIEMLKY